MRRPLTADALLTQMERLNDVFGKFAAGDEILRATAAYREALSDLDLEQVEGAVSMALKGEPRFPYPAKLREYARAWTSANRATLEFKPDPESTEVTCRVCQARPRWAWVVVHDAKTNVERFVQRCIAPCDKKRHPRGSWYVPMPANFVEWMDQDMTPEEFVRAQPARVGGAEA